MHSSCVHPRIIQQMVLVVMIFHLLQLLELSGKLSSILLSFMYTQYHLIYRPSASPRIAPAPKVKKQPDEKYKFTEKVSDDLYCPVMFTLLLEPNLTGCCGKHLSQKAVDNLKKEKKPCPLCNDPAFVTMLDKNLRRQVLELPVFCHNQERGCEWVGELSTFEDHVEKCPKKDNPLDEQRGLGES